MYRIGLALFFSGVVSFTGCEFPKGTATQTTVIDERINPLIGTWEGTDPEAKGATLVLTFTADGKFSSETKIEGLDKDPKGSKIEFDGGKKEGTYKHEGPTVTTTVNGKDKQLSIREMDNTKMILGGLGKKNLTFVKKQ